MNIKKQWPYILIGVAVLLVGFLFVRSTIEKSKINAEAKQDADNLYSAMVMYRELNGDWPKGMSTLEALKDTGYVQAQDYELSFKPEWFYIIQTGNAISNAALQDCLVVILLKQPGYFGIGGDSIEKAKFCY